MLLIDINLKISIMLLMFIFIIYYILLYSEIKQKNEGGWEFYWDEETKPGVVILEVRVAKHLDSSLIGIYLYR